MKRICIFAHYDKDNLIDNYVIYYLKELSKIADKIVFATDSNVSKNELKKIKDYTYKTSTKKHGKYDFGSYQKGYELIKNELNEFDELIVCNDSCYGPLYDLNQIFNNMSERKCDFWGLTQNDDKLKGKPMPPHLQSYFLVFKKPVFTSEVFKEFFNSIEKETQKIDIIEKYEVGLTQILEKQGFKSQPFIRPKEGYENLTIHHWDEIIQECFPLLKVGVIKYPPRKVDVSKWKKVVKETGYPIELIENHLKRVKDFKSFRRHLFSSIYNTFFKG